MIWQDSLELSPLRTHWKCPFALTLDRLPQRLARPQLWDRVRQGRLAVGRRRVGSGKGGAAARIWVAGAGGWAVAVTSVHVIGRPRYSMAICPFRASYTHTYCASEG